MHIYIFIQLTKQCAKTLHFISFAYDLHEDPYKVYFTKTRLLVFRDYNFSYRFRLKIIR